MHPHDRRGGAIAGEIPDLGAPKGDDQFDGDLAFGGWDIALGRNQFLGELVGQLPRSGTIIVQQKSSARSDKEWHMIVHQISPNLDDHFQNMNLKVGERVVISGTPTGVFFNGMEFILCQFNAIQGVLRRRDGEVFVGSVYGEKAIEDGKPAEKGA